VFVILCAAVVFWWNVCAENQRRESDRGALESLSTSELSVSPAPTAKTTLSPVPEITHEVRRAELVATPIEVRRAELVVPPHADKNIPSVRIIERGIQASPEPLIRSQDLGGCALDDVRNSVADQV
jgi:hypothetical protein